MDQPNFQFPRWYPMRGGAGYAGGPANAISAVGDDIASAIGSFHAAQQQKQQNDLANALMNNGQSPGAAPYVRRATYEDGDQGDDPGPVPFDSTDTPYTGGQSMAAALAGQAANQQKQQQQSLANALANRKLSLGERNADRADAYVADPTLVPPGGRRNFAPPRGGKSNMLPQPTGAPGLDPLPSNGPVDEPAMPGAPSAPSTGFGQPSGILGQIMGLLGGGSPAPSGPPDATPSATPLVAQGGVAQVTDAKSYAALPSGSTYRDPNGKVRKKP